MKVAILTLPLRNYNYGGILQCYALQTALHKLGHEVIVIDKGPNKDNPIIASLKHIKHLFLIYIIHDKGRIEYDKYLKSRDKRLKDFLTRNINLQEFIEKNICLSERLQSKKEINNLISVNNINYIIIGSDQVWRPDYTPNILDYFGVFLSKKNDIPIIAYAASFGIDSSCKFNKHILNKCEKLLKRFKAISVRETSGIEICRNDFHVSAIQMPDPTLLLSKEEYRQLYSNSETIPISGKLLIYILDPNDTLKEEIEKFSKRHNMPTFWIPTSPTDTKISIEQWLRYFDEAEFVITDSFHGCLFSIKFGKPFYTIGNTQRGADRFKSILGELGLLQNLIEAKDLCTANIIQSNINYKKLEEMNTRAIKYINSNISD